MDDASNPPKISRTTSSIHWNICACTDTNTNNCIAAINGDLSFASMKKANPSQHGKVIKLHISLLWNIIPSFLQRLVKYCTSRFILSWKEHELIILGNYIYHFYDKSSRSITPTHCTGQNRLAIFHQTDQRYDLHPKLFLPGREYGWWGC